MKRLWRNRLRALHFGHISVYLPKKESDEVHHVAWCEVGHLNTGNMLIVN